MKYGDAPSEASIKAHKDLLKGWSKDGPALQQEHARVLKQQQASRGKSSPPKSPAPNTKTRK